MTSRRDFLKGTAALAALPAAAISAQPRKPEAHEVMAKEPDALPFIDYGEFGLVNISAFNTRFQVVTCEPSVDYENGVAYETTRFHDFGSFTCSPAGNTEEIPSIYIPANEKTTIRLYFNNGQIIKFKPVWHGDKMFKHVVFTQFKTADGSYFIANVADQKSVTDLRDVT